MNVVTTPEASSFIDSHGGVAYVRSMQRKCCGGALTVLSATTQAPPDAQMYEPVGDPSLGVRYRRNHDENPARVSAAATERLDRGSVADGPQELLLELRGRRRPRLAACWDGCAYKM